MLINQGSIAPATVALNDNTGFGALTSPGDHPELFDFTNNGTFIDSPARDRVDDGPDPVPVVAADEPDPVPGSAADGPKLISALAGSELAANDTWLYLYEDGTFLIVFADGTRVTGTYQLTDGMLVFTLEDGTVINPSVDEAGNYVYSIAEHQIVISADYVMSFTTMV